MIDKTKNLQTMLNHFPSWMDIKKRYAKSVGGALLRAYNDEAEDVNAAIKEYQDLFFLLNYYGKEEEIPAYMYIALIGSKNISSIKIPMLEHGEYLTDNVDDFYRNLSGYILYQDDALIMHPSFFGEDDPPDGIEYIIDDTYKYSAKLYYRHIWNVFDEFALFAGIKRYGNESNTELSNRVIQQFANFPNSSSDGLKNAIKNALYNIADISDDDITIEQPNENNLSDNDVYDKITSYNKDLFRVKKWDTSLWEHGFKSVDMLPHEWDKQPSEYQDGTGSMDDLRVDFIDNTSASDTTNVSVTGYKKSKKAITEYLKNNNIETNIKLSLTKIKNNITPQKIEYKIIASDIVKVNAEKIHIIGSKKYSGKNTYYLEDYVTGLDGATKVERNILDAGKDYRLVFEPTSNYSDMRISQIDVIDNAGTAESLLKESDPFIFKDRDIVHRNVLAHITSLNDMTSYSNLKNYNGGFTLDSASDVGTASIALDKSMSFGMINVECECKEADITDSSSYVKCNNFQLNGTGTTIESISNALPSSITITLPKCRSFSFNIDAANNPVRQGAVYVTITRGGSSGRRVLYTKAATISESYSTSDKTEILIQKAGQNPVSISSLKTAMYDIRYKLDSGNVIQNAMYTMLPNIIKDNTLNIELEAYTAYAPVLKSIHIGKSLMGAQYTVDFSTSSQSKLLIDSSCKVTLINKTDGTITSNYITKAAYRNDTNAEAYIFLNISDFSNIVSSSPVLKHKFNGSAKDFIVLQPGEEIDSITINGNNKKTIFDKSLSAVLYDNEPDYEVYVSRVMPSFILKNGSHEILHKISKSSLTSKADTFEYVGLESGISGLYIIEENKNNTYIGDTCDRSFQFMCLCPISSQEYVAYNTRHILRKTTDNIKLDNTFSPVISFTKKFLFMICDVLDINKTRKTTVNFYDDSGERNWSTSSETPIRISSDLDFGSEEIYDADVSELHDKYILSNEIPLSDTYVVNGEEVELAEYIVTVPDGIAIKYNKYECTEELIAENDGFNKLHYSNVVQIVSAYGGKNTVIPASDYQLMGQEGILAWENDSHTGETITVKYVMNKPTSLVFIDEDILYEKIRYNIDAYDKIQTISFSSVKDKDVLYLDFKENPDKIIIQQDNDVFYASLSDDNKSISIIQTRNPDKIAIHNGYLYEGGLEYYYFADKHEDNDSRTKDLEMINTSILGNKLLFRMKSTNYLPHSSMTAGTLARSSAFDFTDKKYVGISGFNSLTACDTFGHWILFNMSVEMSAGHNGYGMSFKSKNTEYPSYAILEITDQIINGNIISVFKSGLCDVSICKESKIDNLALTKDIFIEKSNIVKFSNDGEYFYTIIDYDREPEMRYFMLVYGGGCTIDDIVSMKYTSIKNMVGSHKKNIDKLNIKVAEKLTTNTIKHLKFNYDNAIYSCTERSSTDPTVITTSMSTAYGHTKVADVELDKCIVINARYKGSYISAEDNDAQVTTKPIFIRSRKSVSSIAIKINDVMLDNMSSFNIEVYGCATKDGTYKKIKSEKNTNVINLSSRQAKSYIKIAITDISKNKLISSISVYAEYAETSGDAELTSTPNQRGTFTSMVYDIGANAKFMPLAPDYTINERGKAEFYFRGARENKNTVVFTDWYRIRLGEDEKYNHVLDNYRFVQFRANINSQDTEIAINDFKIKVVG